MGLECILKTTVSVATLSHGTEATIFIEINGVFLNKSVKINWFSCTTIAPCVYISCHSENAFWGHKLIIDISAVIFECHFNAVSSMKLVAHATSYYNCLSIVLNIVGISVHWLCWQWNRASY